MSAATATDTKPAKTETKPVVPETPTKSDEPSRKIEDATPEALSAAQEEWINRQFPMTKKAAPKVADKPKETDEEKKTREDVEAKAKKDEEDKAKAEADTKAAKDEKADKSKKKPVAELPPAPAPAATPVDEDAIAARAAEKIAQAQAQAKAPKVELTPAEQEALRTFEQMEKSDSRYKGLSKQAKDYWAKETAYIEKWQSENEGETFEPDAQEHVAFYKKNTPAYDEDDFKMAERAVLKEELRQDLTKERKESETKMEAQHKLRQAEPEIAAMTDAAVADFVRLSQPEDGAKYSELVGDAKVITPELEQKIEEADPIAKHILVEEGEPMHIMLSELEKITRFPDAYPVRYDAKVRLRHSDRVMYPHSELVSFISELEQKLVDRPPEETAQDGKRLVSNAEFASSVDAILNNRTLNDAQKRQSIQQFKNRYWALTNENFRDAIVGSYASKAKARIQQILKLTSKNGSADKKTTEAKTEAKAGDTKPATEKAKSPSVAAASDNVDTRSPSTVSSEEKTEFFAQRTFGG